MADGLEPLIGEWSIEAVFPKEWDVPDPDARGSVSFEWMEGKQFVIQRWSAPDPAPDGLAVIGPDPEHGGAFLQHYFDTRGVARIYGMALGSGVWKLWRDAPDFSDLPFQQRFEATFSEDGDRIEGTWERTDEGAWIKDFDLTYTRA